MEKKSSKELAKEFIDKLSKEDIESVKNAYAESLKKLIVDAQNKLIEVNLKIAQLTKEKEDTKDIGKRTEISAEISKNEKIPNFYKNLVKCYENAGVSVNFTDKRGVKHEQIPDFKEIKTDVIVFNEETLLEDDIPAYIPFINENEFRSKGYVFDAIRIGKNEYILAANGYIEKHKGTYDYKTSKEIGGGEHPTDAEQGYVLVTLDQLVLINDYYYTKAKAIKIKEAEERNKRSEDYYDKLPIIRRESFLNQKNYWHSLPKAVQKKITQEQYELLNLAEKEALYKPFKKYNPERLKNKLGTNQMWSSFHAMYERFLNPEALPFNKSNVPIPINQPRIFIYGNKEVFEYWYWFVDMMKWKMNDIKVQREIESEIRKIALETSFGESNTNLELKEKYGILVKRQNGSQIQPIEINQIKESWVKVQSVFGGLSHIALNDNLKISHTADKYCYASKAAGMYIPKMKTIAVSNKYGFEKFECIMAHEVAHYIDNRIGESKGERYSTDNYEGTAGVIANKFRKLMNKKSDSDYINSTKECFARALEQYFAIESFGENVSYYESKATGEILYFDAESYTNKANFDGTMKPLIKQFLDEEQTFFKYLVELNNEIPTKTATKEESNEIEKAIETFEMLVNLGGTDAEVKEWNEAIETFKMLVGADKMKNGGVIVKFQKDLDELLKSEGWQTSYYDKNINDVAKENAYQISLSRFEPYYENITIKLPTKMEVSFDWIMNKINKDLVYKSFTENFNKILKSKGLFNVNAYPTTYGIGVFVAAGSHILETKKNIENTLNLLGINYVTEYSDANYVFRYKISKSKENIEKIEQIDTKMKDGGDVENDFDYMSLFKEESPKELAVRLKEQQVSEEQQKENEYQKGKWSKKYASTYKDAVKKTIQSYVDAKKTLEDWGSKVYKTNKGVIYSGGDDIHGTAYTIGGINEHRRKRTMAGAKMQMDEAIETLKELGLKEQEITNLLNSSKEQKSETLSLF